jgi:flagellar L-ring protein precursor FlgH
MTRLDLLRTLAALLLVSVVAPACGPRHVAPFTPRQRIYAPGNYAQKEASAKPTPGSLFSDANPGFLEDTRAVRVGDFVVVQIEENANAQGDSSTNLNKDENQSTNVNALAGIVPALKRAYPDMDPTQLINFVNKSGFVGAGTTERKGQLQGQIAVRVVKEMPNGDLFVEGTKVVLINNEEYHLYLSGLLRPADIAKDNSVASTRLADAQIEFTGRGDIADQNRKGWLARLVDTLNPF